MTEITFTSDIIATLIKSDFDDEWPCFAAWTSTKGAEATPERKAGLINRLMADHHGCYDDQTEVLTAQGWKRWPEVDGTEQFVTLDIATDTIELQHAERLVVKQVDENLIHIKMAHVDLMVTEDHNMVASTLNPGTQPKNGWGSYKLVKARDFLDRTHRLRMGGGEWLGDLHCPKDAALIGFIAADGSYGFSNSGSRQVNFHLSKERKIDWLTSIYDTKERFDSAHARKFTVDLDGDTLEWAKATYTSSGERCLPRELLERGDTETLQALLDGFLMGDGSISPTGHITASAISRQMINDLQELALKVGMAATETASDSTRSGAYGRKPLLKISFYRPRNMQPRVGWTPEARQAQVSRIPYRGNVYCVTVPNGTLYVRRNGKPSWCGNTPFEFMDMTFQVTAPIFVWREHHRHRVGFSYNEESGRYKQLDPVFYMPARDRPLVAVEGSKQMDYQVIPGTITQYEDLTYAVHGACTTAYDEYQRLLHKGILKEVARMVLPVNIMSTCIVKANARSLMNFLSLRTRDDRAVWPSKPMYEINALATLYEAHFAGLAPMTYKAFNANGRVAP